MESLRDITIQNHCDENYENAKIIDYLDKENNGLIYYTDEELKSVSGDWFPLCCFKDELTGKLVYGGRSKIFHTCTEGETGCGKTTRQLIQTVRAISLKKDKPSLIVVDPYGEIYENLYKHFKKRNYTLKVLNCDNPERSDTYNPFEMMARKVLKENNIECVTTQIRELAEMVQPFKDSKDPTWEQGACAYFNGLILDVFEDLQKKKLDKKYITMYNIIKRHFWLRNEMSNESERNVLNVPYYEKKGSQALSIQKMMSVTNNAEKTRDCYYAIVENRLERFNQPGMFQLSSNNTIDIEKFIENPTVIFVQTGATTIGEDLVSLLISDVYNVAINKGRQSLNKRLPRDIHCFIDEFANCNFGSGENFIKMLTTSRKFGIFWHMYLQCDAQLDKKYKSTEIGDIIRANSTEIFMGSQDHRTIERFAQSCGKKTIESINSKIKQDNIYLETVNLINPDTLSTLKEGSVYIKVNRNPILCSYYEAFYKCKEFEKINNLDKIYPYNRFKYDTTLSLQIVEEEPKKRNSFDFDYFDNERDSYKSKLKWVRTDSGNLYLVLDYNNQFDFSKSGCDSIIYTEDIVASHYDILSDRDQEELLHENINLFMKEHMNKLEIDDYVDIMSKINCIPKNMIEQVKDFDSKCVEYALLSLEIIAQFIDNNDYKRINKWKNALKEQVDQIISLDLFPEFILERFTHAIEIFEDYTQDDIKIIKNRHDD